MGSSRSSPTAPVDVQAVARDLREIAGSDHVRVAMDRDAIDGVLPELIVEPGSIDELARAVKFASDYSLQLIPRSGATKMDWGNTPRGAHLILSTRRQSRVVEHAWGDMTATVQAGCTISNLQHTLAEHGQRLALDPLWSDRATVGGVLATNDCGPLRIRYGSLRDLIIGITLVLPDGTIARSGGKVVKNVAGYDLPKLAVGSLGTLGIIAQAIFRLHPIPKSSRTMSFLVRDSAAMNALILSFLDSTLVSTGLQFRASRSAPPEVDIRFEGTETGCDSQLEEASKIATGSSRIEPSIGVWKASELLWVASPNSVICKFSVLPASLGRFLEKLGSEASNVTWAVVGQGVGVGFLRLEGENRALVSILRSLRSELEQQSGSLVILRCPLDVKKELDVWGSVGDALPVMERIKKQFDPDGLLNPGRFVGGI